MATTTSPCPRCGRPAKIIRMSPADLRRNGYGLYQEVTFVSWCGHGHPFVPVLVGEDRVELVPIVGEAS